MITWDVPQIRSGTRWHAYLDDHHTACGKTLQRAAGGNVEPEFPGSHVTCKACTQWMRENLEMIRGMNAWFQDVGYEPFQPEHRDRLTTAEIHAIFLDHLTSQQAKRAVALIEEATDTTAP